MLRLRCRLRAVRIFPVFCAEAQKSGACAPQEYEPSNHGVFRALLSQDKTKAIPFGMTFCFGGDKRDRTADLLNAIDGRVRVHQGQALQKEKPLKYKHFCVFTVFAHFTFLLHARLGTSELIAFVLFLLDVLAAICTWLR